MNLISLDIYFKTLNVQAMTETPKYSVNSVVEWYLYFLHENYLEQFQFKTDPRIHISTWRRTVPIFRDINHNGG